MKHERCIWNICMYNKMQNLDVNISMACASWQRKKEIAHENEGGTFSSTSSSTSSDIYGRIFAMPLPHGVDVDMIHIPVIMLAYPNKRWLTTESTLSVKIVDHSKRIPFAIWPFRAMSMQEVPDDVHKDKKCVANFLRQALHRIQVFVVLWPLIWDFVVI